jgi:phytanoyl-CoA hydroxylase
VWIALDEATVENGCMQLLPGRHREGPKIHFQRATGRSATPRCSAQKSVAAPAPAGRPAPVRRPACRTARRTTPRAKRRRALQYHYTAENVVKWSTAERLKHFGSEGKNVTC